MRKLLLLAVLLAGCGGFTSQRAQQDTTQKASQESEQTASQDSKLGHSDESKTSTMPIVINCIQINTTKHSLESSPCWSRSGDGLPGDRLDLK
jgi:type III secretory pathway component EscV